MRCRWSLQDGFYLRFREGNKFGFDQVKFVRLDEADESVELCSFKGFVASFKKMLH
jgi:superfamily II DNA/RNA helicase